MHRDIRCSNVLVQLVQGRTLHMKVKEDQWDFYKSYWEGPLMGPDVFTGHRNEVRGGHLGIGVILVREVLDNRERVPYGIARGQPGML